MEAISFLDLTPAMVVILFLVGFGSFVIYV